MSNTMMLMHRQERRASRDSEKGREGEDRKGTKKEEGEEEEGGKSIDYTVISGSPGNKQQFLEDQVTTSAGISFSVLHEIVSCFINARGTLD